MDYDNFTYIKSNREQAMSPRKGAWEWCPKCDRDMISSIGKCSVCGYRHKRRRLKKEPN